MGAWHDNLLVLFTFMPNFYSRYISSFSVFLNLLHWGKVMPLNFNRKEEVVERILYQIHVNYALTSHQLRFNFVLTSQNREFGAKLMRS